MALMIPSLALAFVMRDLLLKLHCCDCDFDYDCRCCCDSAYLSLLVAVVGAGGAFGVVGEGATGLLSKLGVGVMALGLVTELELE